MDKVISELFSSELGEKIYRSVIDTVNRYGMKERLETGVLVGLSGGADSVMLLLFLNEYRRREGLDFPILAVHINHMIRGAEADRDEEFSGRLAASCGAEFVSRRIDVPQLSAQKNIGIEEMARNVRYSEFASIISGRENISTVATAHNATDNAETVIFNIARGCGARGGAGIAPVRDNIVRPLIAVKKEDIISLLDLSGVKYMVDSTNYSTEYSRNYIRHELLPRLERLNANHIASISAFSESLRDDVDFIESMAKDFLADRTTDRIPRSELVSLHPSLLARVITLMAKEKGASSLERVHVREISRLLHGGGFKYSVPSGLIFVYETGVCRFLSSVPQPDAEFSQHLETGINKLSGYDAVISLGEKTDDFSRNVYKFSIHADLSSAIIIGSLRVRFRRPGDSYRYGGMTHKLKKVFNDKEVPPTVRDRIPVICDDNGVVWVPGLPARDDGVRNKSLPITFSVLSDSSDMPTFAVGMTY